jgi:hypothetical protein
MSYNSRCLIPKYAEEFRHFYEKLASGATVVFHDTGAQHEGLADAIKELIAQGQLAGSSRHFRRQRATATGTAGSHSARIIAEDSGSLDPLIALQARSHLSACLGFSDDTRMASCTTRPRRGRSRRATRKDTPRRY